MLATAGPSCFFARLVVKCVAADVEGLHVDMTVQDYVFHLLFTPKPRPHLQMCHTVLTPG